MISTIGNQGAAGNPADRPRESGIPTGNPAPALDRTPAGPQHVLPGTEHAKGCELARRQAAAPLKPRVPQSPCDVGLFGDGAAQLDLVDILTPSSHYEMLGRGRYRSRS